MKTLKDKEDKGFDEDGIKVIIKFYKSEDVKKAVLEFEKYLIKEELGTNIKFKFKDIFGDFEK